MREAALGELFQRAIDLRRRAEAVVAQPVEEIIGGHRRGRVGEGTQHQLLIARQIVGPDVVVAGMIVLIVRVDHG